VENALDLARAATEYLGAPVRATSNRAACFVPTDDDEEMAAAVLGATSRGRLAPRESEASRGGAASRAPEASRGHEAGPFVLAPGSGWRIKNGLPDGWAPLAANLARRYGAPPLVTGGPGETGLVGAVVEASGGRARSLAGRLSLGALAALFRQARLVIATD